MNYASRLQLIKSRLVRKKDVQTKPRGLFAAAHPEHVSVKPKGGPVPFAQGPGWYVMHEESGFSEGRNVGWVQKPIMKRKKPLGEKQRHEPHALTQIAEKWKELKR